MKRALLVHLLLLHALIASAQRFTVGVNAADCLALGTLNLEGSAGVSRRVSIHAGVELNPWTFNAGDASAQKQARQNSWWAGARFWPWHIYSGWWAGADLRYTVYNAGGFVSRKTEEGDAVGAGLYGGYAVMLSDRWNLDLGAGVWGGWKKYTVYACPLCGVRTENGEKTFVVPDVRIAIQYIF
ncbi:MAG: DUF3575 domain-containing protein [Bacteroidales bacterium]|nr:DUF3575 domain-containing protein [Bacteroidales bacterium]